MSKNQVKMLGVRVPLELHRSAKSVAARTGLSLEAFCREAITRHVLAVTKNAGHSTALLP